MRTLPATTGFQLLGSSFQLLGSSLNFPSVYVFAGQQSSQISILASLFYKQTSVAIYSIIEHDFQPQAPHRPTLTGRYQSDLLPGAAFSKRRLQRSLRSQGCFLGRQQPTGGYQGGLY